MKNIGIVGGRDFSDYQLAESKFLHLTKNIDVSRIVSGGAKGVDTMAKMIAKKQGYEILEFLPDYNKFGRGAPLMRNTTIIENSDYVIAFWDGKSRGTLDSINKARKQGKPIKIVNY
jgi:predicted Rossmann fold nucleotide-binding protein DprA/Smf involved in DNA uptake